VNYVALNSGIRKSSAETIGHCKRLNQLSMK
jgi:hypothetical protein